MDKKRVLVIGLEDKDVKAIRAELGLEYILVHYDLLPKVQLHQGTLLVESPSVTGKFYPVDKVIFHGIFADDYDFITLLALWGGPCLPNATGMMDLRQRIPGLARALKVSRFSGIKRSMVLGGQPFYSPTEVVAKWGIWHCGEDKAKFTGEWTSTEPSVIEDFIEGDAVRIMIVGDQHWQIKLTGDTWLKSIHNEGSGQMPINSDLLEDSQNIARRFNLLTVGVDYIVGHDGTNYLLEVNHIPNVTVFPFVNEAFVGFSANWVKQ